MGRVYTRGGDKGQTSLGDGTRVSKDNPRVDTSGVLDETMSALGLAKSLAHTPLVEPISRIQRELIFLMSRISRSRPDAPIPSASEIEERIEAIRVDVPMPDVFILPGDSPCGGALHMARSMVRRAERSAARVVRESAAEGTPGMDDDVLKYINRLSDLLFAMALWADREELVYSIARMVVKRLRCTTGRVFSIEGGTNPMTVLLKDAKVLLEAMEKKALEVGVPMAMAVSDGDGKLVAFTRQENVLPVSIDLARKKAYTAIQLRMPSDDLAGAVKPGDSLYGLQHTDPGIVVFGGGIPLWKDGELIGAVGVSGGSVAQDIAVADAGVAAWKAVYK